MFRGKKDSPKTVNDILDTVLFTWPGQGSNKWTIRDSTMGCQIFGATGSGKSSGSGKKIAKAFLNNGYGGLVLCAKPGERKDWEDYASQCGRQDDLVIFDKASGLQFNPLVYEMQRFGEGAGESLNIVEIIMVLFELGKSFMAGGQTGGDERFWDNALRRAIRRTIDLLRLSNEKLTFENLRRIIASALNSRQAELFQDKLDIIRAAEKSDDKDQLALAQSTKLELESLIDDPEADRYCLRCLYTAYKTKNFTQEELDTYFEVKRYFMQSFANLNERTRSIVEERFLGVVEPFSGGILKKHLSTEVSKALMPEKTFEEGKIIILDFPVKQYLLAGVYAQGIYKHIWQQAMERRTVSDSENRPCFMWGDEVQFFLTEYDSLFASTARSSLVSTAILTLGGGLKMRELY